MHRQDYFLHAHGHSVSHSFPLSLFSSYTRSAQTKALSFSWHTRLHTTMPPCWGKWWGGVLNYWWSWPRSWKTRGGGGVCFQKPKLPLTWGQSFCPSEPCSNLQTLASVRADAIWKIKDACCCIERQCAVFSNVWHCKMFCCSLQFFTDTNLLFCTFMFVFSKKNLISQLPLFLSKGNEHRGMDSFCIEIIETLVTLYLRV